MKRHITITTLIIVLAVIIERLCIPSINAVELYSTINYNICDARPCEYRYHYSEYYIIKDPQGTETSKVVIDELHALITRDDCSVRNEYTQDAYSMRRNPFWQHSIKGDVEVLNCKTDRYYYYSPTRNALYFADIDYFSVADQMQIYKDKIVRDYSPNITNSRAVRDRYLGNEVFVLTADMDIDTETASNRDGNIISSIEIIIDAADKKIIRQTIRIGFKANADQIVGYRIAEYSGVRPLEPDPNVFTVEAKTDDATSDITDFFGGKKEASRKVDDQ